MKQKVLMGQAGTHGLIAMVLARCQSVLCNTVSAVLLGLSLLLASGLLQAQSLVAVPALSGRVVDLTGTFTAAQKAELSAQLEALERQKGSQLVVLMVPTTQPEDIAQFSIRVAEAWKIGRGKAGPAGQKVDDGVILLVAKNDRKLRIEVGYGLEGAIPDALAKRIITDSITPKFKSGDFYGGVHAGVDDLSKLIQGEALPAPPEVWQQGQNGPAAQDGGDSVGWLVPLIAVLVFGFILRAILGRFLGSAAAGGAAWFVSTLFGAPALIAIIAAVVIFLFLLIFGGSGSGLARQGRRSYGSGSFGGFGGGGGGGSWGGGGGGGGFSGGGGGFGGGGASGDW